MFGIEPRTPNAYYMPGADPGDGYMATNDQLYGSVHAPASWPIVTGTVEGDIMGCFTPAALPVLSALATGFADCDQWFASVPAETLPNRAFTCAATGQGHMNDKTHTFTSPTIFGR